MLLKKHAGHSRRPVFELFVSKMATLCARLVLLFPFLLLVASLTEAQQGRSFNLFAKLDPFKNFVEFNRRFQQSRPQPRTPFDASCKNSDLRSYDGSCNNVRNPTWGIANSPFLILSQVTTYDVAKMPNPRFISNTVCREAKTPPSKRKLSELVTFTGQFIDHTFTETFNSKDKWPISIPPNDPVFKGRGQIEFFRTAKRKSGKWLAPNNLLPSFLDLSAIYGKSEKQAKALRVLRDGLLVTAGPDYLSKNAKGFYVSGDDRVNENPHLTAMHTLFNREHNSLCKEIIKAYPLKARDDEFVFNLARKVNIAQFQAAVYYGFLPAVIGHDLVRYKGYNNKINPTMSNEFSTVAFRVGHTMINPTLSSVLPSGARKNIDLSTAFFKPSVFESEGMDALLRALVTTRNAEIDVGVTNQVQDFLAINGRVMLDLVALNIHRGRDNGVPYYNELRVAYGLRRVTSFAGITRNPEVQKKLQTAYGNVESVDPWIGGIAEDHIPGGSLGPLFAAIWKRQFQRLRDGDRFYFEKKGHFRTEEIIRIPTLRDLMLRFDGKRNAMRNCILRNSNLKPWEVPRNPFFAK